MSFTKHRDKCVSVTTTSSLNRMWWALYCYVLYHKTVFRQSGELSHQRLEFNQVLSLKYFSCGAITPVHCTGAGAAHILGAYSTLCPEGKYVVDLII